MLSSVGDLIDDGQLGGLSIGDLKTGMSKAFEKEKALEGGAQ
jgi:hypothetical protein